MRHSLLTIVIVLVITMGLSSCLCQPRYASFLNLVEKKRNNQDFPLISNNFSLKKSKRGDTFCIICVTLRRK